MIGFSGGRRVSHRWENTDGCKQWQEMIEIVGYRPFTQFARIFQLFFQGRYVGLESGCLVSQRVRLSMMLESMALRGPVHVGQVCCCFGVVGRDDACSCGAPSQSRDLDRETGNVGLRL